jgi:hypothetical protein
MWKEGRKKERKATREGGRKDEEIENWSEASKQRTISFPGA